MRIWTIHPKYLDTKGLLAAWREGLLAQKSLQGKTKGYKNHPQLDRFKAVSNPVGAIGKYLSTLAKEAEDRGYSFDADKIKEPGYRGKLRTNRGQLLFEWEHLKKKLYKRDREKYNDVADTKVPRANPTFKIVPGEKEDWEKG